MIDRQYQATQQIFHRSQERKKVQAIAESKNSLPTDELKSKFNKFLEEVNEHQRFWLSGYLEALINKSNQSQESNSEPVEVLNIAVAYASQTGNARLVAQQLHQKLQSLPVNIELHDCASIQPSQLSSYSLVWFVTSTHGEGEPPESASNFFHRLENRRVDFTGTSFAVFALGDSSYEQFCEAGIWLSTRMVQLGAEQIHQPKLCDLDYQTEVEDWLTQAFETSQRKAEEQANHKTISSAVATKSTAVVVNKQLLNDPRSDKKTWHFEIETPLEFEPGDALAIQPTNPTDLIDRLQPLLDPVLNQSQLLDTKVIQELYSDLLARDLSRVTHKLLLSYIECSGNEALKKYHSQHTEQELRAWLREINLVTLLSQYPPQASAEAVIDWLRSTLVLQPRLYSIASSPLEFANEIHIAVRVIDREIGSPFGIASNMLCQAPDESELQIHIERQEHFKLPADQDRDLIMIGPGTGIAPYRSFLQHRKRQGSKAQHWLFYGDRTMRYDFLYQQEILNWKEQGLLTRLDTAFSRQGRDKQYVQHTMQQHAKELWQWLDKGAVIYVCGDASAMAPAVHTALTNIVAQEKKCSAEEAEHYIEELRSNKRYQRDVY